NRNNDATFLHYTVRSRQSIAAHGIENDIDILNYILKLSGGVIDRPIYSKLLKKVLVCGGCGRDNFGAACFGNLHSKRPYPAAAITRMSTSSSFGCGRGASSYFNTSGPPEE